MFFEHEAPGQGEPYMRNTTRYLCAAGYLDRSFRDQVIAEYIEDEHRAVSPGGGYDLEQVVKHCLQARRFVLIRDLVLVLVTVGALALALEAALATLFLSAVAAFGGQLWRSLPDVRWRLGAMAGLAVVSVALVSRLGFDILGSDQGYDYETGAAVEDPGGGFWTIVLIFVLYTAIVFGHVMFVYRVMRRTLYPLSAAPPPGSPSPHTMNVLARIAAAQRGNVSLYSAHPFLGAGEVKKEWAIVLELDRPAAGGGGEGRRADPAELHARVWRRLQQMKMPDPGDAVSLLPHESVAGLERPEMHLVARGRLPQYRRPLGRGDLVYDGHPLIDPSGVPYSRASAEAVQAVIHHPQGSLRCYLKISVDSRGQLVCGRDDAVVAPAEDQDVATTAFFHVAVEGRMLYAQFVATALLPVRDEFKIVDELPSTAGGWPAWHAFRRTWRGAPAAAVKAGPRVVRTSWHMFITSLRAGVDQPQRRTVHDYGFRISPRELAAEDGFATYLQLLDTDKYIRLIERRINEAVLDYLTDECGVDVSAYREQMGAIIQNSVKISGSTITGSQINTGAGATLHQSPTP